MDRRGREGHHRRDGRLGRHHRRGDRRNRRHHRDEEHQLRHHHRVDEEHRHHRDSRHRPIGQQELRDDRHQEGAELACHWGHEEVQEAAELACLRECEEAWEAQLWLLALLASHQRSPVQALLELEPTGPQQPGPVPSVRAQGLEGWGPEPASALVDALAWLTRRVTERPAAAPVRVRVRVWALARAPLPLVRVPASVPVLALVPVLAPLLLVLAQGPAEPEPWASASASAPQRQARVRARAQARLHGSGHHARPCDANGQLGARRCWRSDSSPRCPGHRKDRGSPGWTSPFLLRAHRHGLLLARMTHPRGSADGLGQEAGRVERHCWHEPRRC